MSQAVKAINKYNSFLITAHVNLEGDSLGSQLAMKALLEKMGKSAFILDDDIVPEHYKFLPCADEVLNDIEKDKHFDAVIILDCPTIKRIGKVVKYIKSKPIINIDHHISNERFGDINWVDPNASSAGEMVYMLFKEMKVPLTKESALDIYIAILTDTGSFNYENTSGVTHEVASKLLGYGLEPALVSEKVYERRSVSDIKLLGLVLSNIEVLKGGEIACLTITRQMLKKTGADLSKSEGLVNYARSIDKVKVAILFKEDLKDKNKINMSFRSKSGIDVNTIASYFGGGGHTKAAGCTARGTLKEVKKKVLEKVKSAIKNQMRKPTRPTMSGPTS